MEQEINFHIAKTWDDKTQFTDDKIKITVNQFSYHNGKHKIINPQTATAQFASHGKVYMVVNNEGIQTVEDWYIEELLPKFQMLNLLELL